MKNKSWFWVLFLLLLAGFIILSQTQFFREINIMSILATVLLAAVIVSRLPKRDYFWIFVPLALLYIMYSKQFKLMYISPWLLILSAVLVSSGFSMLFPRQHLRKAISGRSWFLYWSRTSYK